MSVPASIPSPGVCFGALFYALKIQKAQGQAHFLGWTV